MKLLLITNLYPCKEDDKDSTIALHYYTRQWAKQHHVHVVTLHAPNMLEVIELKQRKLPASFTLDGVNISNRIMLRLPGGINIYPTFHKEFIAQFDALIGHMPVGASMAYRLSTKFQKPFVQGIHYTDFKRSGVRYGRLTKKYAKMINGARAIGFRSHFLQDKFNKTIPRISEKSFLIPGGVDSIWLKNVPSKEFDKKKPFQILTVANLIRRKNIDIVIQSLKTIEIPNWTYKIVGDGPEKENLSRMANECGINSKVKFEGFMPNADVMNQMDHSEIFVMVSEYETFGLVYLEAMARGCLVVAAANEGVDGIVRDGENGFLCNPNRESLGQTLQKIVEKPSNQLVEISNQAKQTAKGYSYPKLSKAYLQQLEEFLR